MVYSKIVSINASTGAWKQLGTESGVMDLVIYGSVAYNLRTPFDNVTDATNATGVDHISLAGTTYIAVDPSKTWVRGNSGAGDVTYLRQH